MKIYNKLVRDLIPQVIEGEGKKRTTRILHQDEFDLALTNKLTEEVQEFVDQPSVEELADTIEVVHALARRLGASIAALVSVRQEKCSERGGFVDRIFHESVSDAEQQGHTGLHIPHSLENEPSDLPCSLTHPRKLSIFRSQTLM